MLLYNAAIFVNSFFPVSGRRGTNFSIADMKLFTFNRAEAAVGQVNTNSK